MQLPNKLYEPDVTAYRVSYFPRSNSNEESFKSLDFPKWLTNGIIELMDHAYNQGYNKKADEIKAVLGVK